MDILVGQFHDGFRVAETHIEDIQCLSLQSGGFDWSKVYLMLKNSDTLPESEAGKALQIKLKNQRFDDVYHINFDCEAKGLFNV